jgi:hypothetical protein
MPIHDTWPSGFKTELDITLVSQQTSLWLAWTDLATKRVFLAQCQAPSGRDRFDWKIVAKFGGTNVLTGPAIMGSLLYRASEVVLAFGISNQIIVGSWGFTSPYEEVPLQESTAQRPALAWWDNRLWLAWTGGDKRLNTLNAVSHLDFGDKRTYDDSAWGAPGLASDNNILAIGWTGTNEAHTVNVGQIQLGADEVRNKIEFKEYSTETGVSMAGYTMIEAMWAERDTTSICSLQHPWDKPSFYEDTVPSQVVPSCTTNNYIAYVQDDEIWVGRTNPR